MCGIIRIITDNKPLINNNIEKNKIELYKNDIFEEIKNEDENDNDEIDNQNSEFNKNPIILNSNNLKLSKNELLSKSFEYLNNLDNNVNLNQNKSFVNSIEVNNKTQNDDSSKLKYLNGTKDKSSLNSTNIDLNISTDFMMDWPLYPFLVLKTIKLKIKKERGLFLFQVKQF